MSRGKIVDEIRGDELGERRIVEAIVGRLRRPRRRDRLGAGAGMSSLARFRGMLPLALMTTLIVAVGAYAAVTSRRS